MEVVAFLYVMNGKTAFSLSINGQSPLDMTKMPQSCNAQSTASMSTATMNPEIVDG
jgi:hypothetical protein